VVILYYDGEGFAIKLLYLHSAVGDMEFKAFYLFYWKSTDLSS
jgi:hypothetical protein